MKKKKLLKKLIETLQADAARLRQERADVHDKEKREEEAARDQSSRTFQLLTALLPTVLPIFAPSLSGHGGRPCGCAGSEHEQGEISPDAMRDIVDRVTEVPPSSTSNEDIHRRMVDFFLKELALSQECMCVQIDLFASGDNAVNLPMMTRVRSEDPTPFFDRDKLEELVTAIIAMSQKYADALGGLHRFEVRTTQRLGGRRAHAFRLAAQDHAKNDPSVLERVRERMSRMFGGFDKIEMTKGGKETPLSILIAELGKSLSPAQIAQIQSTLSMPQQMLLMEAMSVAKAVS